MDKAKLEIIDRDVAIATLEKQLRESAAEFESAMAKFEEEKEQAIAKLKTELTAGEVKQLNLFPGQEPIPEAKLLNPRQLAEWINENCNPEKPINDHNTRDWFKKDSKCTDGYRAEMQEKYGFKFSHHSEKGTCLFLIPE